MDEPVIVNDVPGAHPLPEITGEVDFEDVTIGYEEGIHVLEGLNLHVQAGESIALVGCTGAGKSTIKNCDRILYVSDKGIAEMGSHEELMAKKGLYYQLYTTQTLGKR